jgi:D-arginine dehydrogenase
MPIEKQDAIVIVGGGIAAAATSYFLTQKGRMNLVILEKEKTAGTGSSGRNAAILRTLIGDPLLRGLARKSAEFYRRPPSGFTSHPLVNPVGVYLAARDAHAADLLASLEDEIGAQGPQNVPPEHLYRQIPLLAAGLTTILFEKDEGVFDVHEIVQSFLSGACKAGAQLRTSCEATSLRIASGAVQGVETSAGFVAAKQVVMACGGWGARLADDAGYPLPLVPFRRHLLVTQPLPQVDKNWPVVWIQGDEFYFRPESGGLLMCGCDAVPVSPEQGETLDPAEIESIAVKAARWLPSLAEARLARAWAGMRTFAPDQRFVVGADPRLKGLFWVAGLGGHGITCAPAVGATAAAWICGHEPDEPAARALAPERLLC